MPKYWINTISKEHVLRGVKEGITQAGHGKESPLRRLHQGDWIVFYSPKQSLEGTEKLQAFTALGQIADEVIYQVEMSSTFKPFRRKVKFQEITEASIVPLIPQLSFIMDKTHWGFMFRFGLFEIPESDFLLIREQMTK